MFHFGQSKDVSATRIEGDRPVDKVLKFKEIGDTGLRVSDICFGTAPLAGMPETFGYDVDEERAAETISAILDSGVNFIDTSNN